MGATDTEGRLFASIFRCGPVDPSFSGHLDVPNGGVLLSLPGLLHMGLLRHADKYFELPNGYYRMDTIFLLLGFMALTRIKNIEFLRYCSPGEWGKLLGIDRIPEAKTLRDKVRELTTQGQPAEWGGELSRDWMGMFPETAGVLYVDGHVRVYNGNQTELPRHYVSRQKLCLRATTDYWVNAMDGQPFFLVNKAVDPGLLTVLTEDIIPRLERDVPEQPNLFELEQESLLPRFTVVFDREGYSPDFMLLMRKKRIACMTYHKYPNGSWPEAEFTDHTVSLVSSHEVTMKLAERGSLLGGKIWVREIRKLSEQGHQTAIISTNLVAETSTSAATMFARWSQENFFKYMREHFNIDRVIDYTTEDIPGTTKVVNPLFRDVDNEVRKQAAKLGRKRCEYNSVVLCDDIEPNKVDAYELKKHALLEEVQQMETILEDLKVCRKGTPRHVMLSDLPKEDQFRQLGTRSKYFIDTIKMVAYRSETAVVNILRRTMKRLDDARSLARSLYKTEADILPDPEKKILKVRLHQPANRCSAVTIGNLCQELNATETIFPGTDLRLVYEMVS